MASSDPRPEPDLPNPSVPQSGGGAPEEQTRNPEFDMMWRGILEGTDPRYRNWRGWLQRLPASRRCHMCAAPFGGPIAPFMKFLGRTPWHRNPNFCKNCFVLMESYGGAPR